MIFPWQIEQWQYLWRAKQANRLAHALLFVGMGGIGKKKFTEHFVRSLLCQQVTNENSIDFSHMDNCVSNCHSCRLIIGQTHPNVLWIQSEKEGQDIKIDQIRSVTEFVNQTSLQGDYRIVVIESAQQMNSNAANALLKTLEEPSSGAMIILISENKRLPATILSRCQHLIFPRPSRHLAMEWLNKQIKSASLTENGIDLELLLNIANGAPLAALRLIQNDLLSVRQTLFQALCTLKQDPSELITLAANLQTSDPLLILDFILNWIMDLLRLQLGAGTSHIINHDYIKQLTELSQRIPIHHNTKLMNYLQQLRAQISIGFNLNKQLTLENMLIRYSSPD